MTNESISGFLNSIAEAKRAFDAEPEYQSRIRDLEEHIQKLGSTVAQRELRIHQLKTDLDEQSQKLRSAEVERDDAGFRALEEADKVQGLLTIVRSFVGEALKAVSAVEGREIVTIYRSERDELEGRIMTQGEDLAALEREGQRRDAEIIRLNDEMLIATEQLTRPFAQESMSGGTDTHAERFSEGASAQGTESVSNWARETGRDIPLGGQREPDPTRSGLTDTVSTSTIQPSSNVPMQSAGSADVVPTSTACEGQSDGPFAAQESHSESASSTTAVSTEDAASSASPPERWRDETKRFVGRKYFDVTYYVSLPAWLAGGGTEVDYYWRPTIGNLPQVSRASHNS